MKFIKSLWYCYQRRLDLELLWPACRKAARNPDRAPMARQLGRTESEMAKAAFAVHAFQDPAWKFLGDDEIIRIIDGLK